MNWEDYKVEFVADGNLRNIYVQDTELDDWQVFIDFLNSTDAKLDFYVDGNIEDLPGNIFKTVNDHERKYLISIRLGDITVNCHFLEPGKIELDIESKQIDTESKAKIIFRFMSTVGRTLNKVVVLTQAGKEAEPVFKYVPGRGVKYLVETNKKKANSDNRKI